MFVQGLSFLKREYRPGAVFPGVLHRYQGLSFLVPLPLARFAGFRSAVQAPRSGLVKGVDDGHCVLQSQSPLHPSPFLIVLVIASAGFANSLRCFENPSQTCPYPSFINPITTYDCLRHR